MNLISKSVKYISGEEVLIPFEGRASCHIKEGNSFKMGEELFNIEKRKIVETYSLSKELEIKEEKSKDYVCRIEGEYITKGEVIAEKLVSGGLFSKRVFSKSEGIVDFSRIDTGYVDILAETEVEVFKPKFSGNVVDINLGRGMTVLSDVCIIPLFAVSSFNKKKYLTSAEVVFGEFEVLGDAESIPSTKNLKDSYEDKIVFAGRFLYPEIISELFSRGAKFVLVGSMYYMHFTDLKLPAGLLTGYGNICFDEILFDVFQKLEGNQVCIDFNSNSMKILVGLNNKFSELIKQNYFKKLEVGDIVKSLEIESFGMVGKVISFENGKEQAKVAMQNGSTLLISVDNLEICQEDFSILGFGIY